MSQLLSERLREAEVLETKSAGGLQVFGLRWEVGGTAPPYRTLDEALAAGTLEVTEVTEEGAVPRLKVANRGDAAVFLMAGEQLVGAKQNRILNTSLLVPANSELAIPVSCVEAGRWGYASPKFGSGGTMSHGKLRKMLSQQTHDSYDAEGYPSSRQGEVWQEIDRKLGSMGTVSPSAALQETYEQHRARLQELLDSLGVSDRCHGAAFAAGERVLGADLFDRPETLAKLWTKVARAYAIDALEQPEAAAPPAGAGASLPAERVKEWLRSAADAPLQSYKSPGLGYDVRIRGAAVVGGSLVVEDRPVHAELFGA
jgi:hypothetical protein